MLRRFLFCPLLIVFFHLLQYVLIPFSYNGVSPDYLLLLIVAVSIFENPKYASLYGLIVGLLADYSVGIGFGTRAMVFMLLSWGSSYLVNKSLTKGLITNSLCVLVVYIISRIVYWCEYLVSIGPFSITEMFINVIFPEIIMTMIISPITFFIVKLVLKKSSRQKKYR